VKYDYNLKITDFYFQMYSKIYSEAEFSAANVHDLFLSLESDLLFAT